MHFRACLANCRGSEYLSIRREEWRVALTRQAPAKLVALCYWRQLAASCMYESQHQRTYRLQLQLDLGVGDCAPGGDNGPDTWQ